jgi:hypothetical protein
LGWEICSRLWKIAKFSGTNAFAEHSKHDRSRLFELARVLVRFDHVASFIVNTNHSITPNFVSGSWWT